MLETRVLVNASERDVALVEMPPDSPKTGESSEERSSVPSFDLSHHFHYFLLTTCCASISGEIAVVLGSTWALLPQEQSA